MNSGQPNCVAGVGRQACDACCAATACDAAARFFVSLRCQVMIVVTGRLAIKRNAREASFQGVGRRRAVAGARGPARLRSRGRHLVYGHQRSGIRRARVNVVRSNAQMGGVPASCRFCPLGLLICALVPLCTLDSAALVPFAATRGPPASAYIALQRICCSNCCCLLRQNKKLPSNRRRRRRALVRLA